MNGPSHVATPASNATSMLSCAENRIRIPLWQYNKWSPVPFFLEAPAPIAPSGKFQSETRQSIQPPEPSRNSTTAGKIPPLSAPSPATVYLPFA